MRSSGGRTYPRSPPRTGRTRKAGGGAWLTPRPAARLLRGDVRVVRYAARVVRSRSFTSVIVPDALDSYESEELAAPAALWRPA